MRRMCLLCAIALLCMTNIVYAQDVYALLQGDEQLRNAAIGVHIVDVDTRRVVASYNAEKAFVPASVMKVVTAATVMKCYGSEKQMFTTVSYTGSIVDSVLLGDVVVRGVADPSLGHKRSKRPKREFVNEVVDAIHRAGIKNIVGNIIVDASCCATDGYTDWMLEDVGYYYGAPCYGVNYMGNAYELPISTGAIGTQPQLLDISPEITVERYGNYLKAGERDSSFVITYPYATEAMLVGVVPANRDTFKLQCAMPDPPVSMARDIYASLQSSGVAIEGEKLTDRMIGVYDKTSSNDATILYNHPSDSLCDILCAMMKYSDNLYAESMLRWVAFSTHSVVDIRTAIDLQYQIWREEGLDISQLNVRDGSGLSRKNTVTPQFLSSLLVDAYHDEHLGEDYVALFPIAGKEATVRSFMSRKPLSGLLRVKSGSMSGVLCYAGYYKQGNKTYAIVLMGNNYRCKNAYLRSCYERLLHHLFD